MKLIYGMVAVALVLTGCAAGSSEGATDTPPSTTAPTSSTTTARPAATTSTSTTTTSTTSTTTSTTTTTRPATTTTPPTTAAPATAPPAPRNLMPNVVCMNLQAAQDFIQSETGVFYSRSEDATGAGRSQILDSNWIVVAQRPAPGTPIGEGDAVLSAVKLDEPNDC